MANVNVDRNRRSDADRWTAVLGRDRAADGLFVYAVTSTGVFCRPTCPSRRPARERVRFFGTAAEAEREGFRACRRCHPAGPAGDPWLAKVAEACRLIARADGPLPLVTLATHAGSSRYHFLRNFTRIVGVTPRAFADAKRFDAVKQQLREQGEVTTAFLEAGYASSSRFYEGAGARLAMTPTTYQNGGKGEVIRCACASTPLGRVLVGATHKGVCSVSFGDSDEIMLSRLREEYPGATLVRDSASMGTWVRQIVDHLSGRMPRLELPLDIRATAFQWQVWNALRAIPPGATRTYAQVAASIGRPTAARAVARACGANPVALAVPCHRVVPASGDAGGYRWGRDRKERLLQRERGEAAS
jgi:AraC family transcriptional regulator of adaptative response/methylated-DNA-[protein]-cysteine methyltransferase